MGLNHQRNHTMTTQSINNNDTIVKPEINLRDYQLEAIDSLAAEMKKGTKRVILQSPTGSGKTEVAAKIMQEAALKNKRCLFLCDRKTLIQQTSDRFAKYGIDHGIIQAKNTRDTHKNIIVGTAQSIKEELNGYDLIIIDEAHTKWKNVDDFLLDNPQQFAIGLTATPHRRGMGDVWQKLINVTTTNKLIEQGFLTKFTILRDTTAEINRENLRTNRMGEYVEADIEKEVKKIVTNVVQLYIDKTQEYFNDSVPTLIFSSSIAHGEDVKTEMSAKGYNFEQLTCHHSLEEQQDKIEQLKEGKVDGLISCEVLGKGFDCPQVQCLIFCRPYKTSIQSVIQQFGRGLRPHPNKEFCLVLDCCGNYTQFEARIEHFFSVGATQFLPHKEHKKKFGATEKMCPGCDEILPIATKICPHCGHRFNTKQIQEIEVELQEVSRWRDTITNKYDIWQQCCAYANLPKYIHKTQTQKRWHAINIFKNLTENKPPEWEFHPANNLNHKLQEEVLQNAREYYRNRNQS